MSDAITFSFGGDISGYKKACAEAVAEMQSTSAKIKQAAQSAGGEEFKKTGEHAFSAATKMQMLGHAVRSVSDQVAAGQSAVRAMSMEMGRLGPVLGIGIGAAVGLTAFSMLIGKISEAESEAEKLKESLNEALLPDNPDFSTIEGLKKKLEEVHKVSKDIKTELQSVVSGTLTEAVGNPISRLWASITGGPEVAKFDPIRDSIQAREKEGALEIGITGKQSQQLAEKQTGFSVGEDAGARARIERELRERLGAAEKLETHEGRRAAGKNAWEQYRIENEELDKKLAKKNEDVALERELNRIKKEGSIYSGVEEAEARLKSAREDLARANDEERGAAQNKVKAAEEAVRQAQRELNITQLRHSAEVEISSFTGTAEEKKTLELQKQLEIALEIQRTAKPNEQPQADRTVADAKWALYRNGRQIEDQSYNTAAQAADARKGRGQSEEIAAEERKLKIAKDHLDVLKKDTESRVEDRVALQAEITAMENRLADMKEARERAIADAELQTELMQAQADHQTTIAEALQIELRYRDRITQALKDGNTELANQLAAQQQIETHEVGVRRHSMTFGQRQAEKAQKRRDQWESDSFDREVDDVQREMNQHHKQGTHVIGKDGKGNDITTNDFGTGRRGDVADEIKQANKTVDDLHSQGLAKDIKNGAEYLKKNHADASGKSEFSQAIEGSKVLQAIAKNTEGVHKNR